MKSIVLMVCLALGICAAGMDARAAVVVLDFRTSGPQGAAFDFNASTGSYVTDGIQLSFQSLINGSPGGVSDILNATASSYGVNSASVTDDTDELDTEIGSIEGIRITFTAVDPNKLVRLQSVQIGSFGVGSAGTLTINGGTPIALASGTVSAGNQNVTGGNITVVSGAGSTSDFGFFGVTLDIVALPEPSSVVLLGSAGAVLLSLRRRLKTA